MMATEMLKWWYGHGWGMLGTGLLRKLGSASDFFSLGLLLRTLFEPFKQISTGSGSGTLSLEARFQAFLDRLVSRIVGTIVRLGLLIIGVVMVILEAVLGVVLLVVWPVVPLLPVVSIGLMVMGVTF